MPSVQKVFHLSEFYVILNQIYQNILQFSRRSVTLLMLSSKTTNPTSHLAKSTAGSSSLRA